MDENFKRYTDFLVGLGTNEVPHSGKPFLAHLIGVYRDLQEWGCDEDVCLGGMFHSIYGTERFQKFCLPVERRSEVRDLIGERAERLGYLNCAMDRPVFDATVQQEDSYRYVDRLTQEECDLPPRDFNDLCTIQVCDWLEQVPRLKDWDYRREAYRTMAYRLGGIAQESYDRVFKLETADSID